MSKKLRTEAVDHLFDAILSLQNKEECYTFFEEMCIRDRGKAGHAIFLDTATLKYEYAPIKLENTKIVIDVYKRQGVSISLQSDRPVPFLREI